jgi:hypothetical protein
MPNGNCDDDTDGDATLNDKNNLLELAGRNFGKVIEEEPPSTRHSSRSLNRKDKPISPK